MYTWMHFIIKMAFLLFYLRFAAKSFRKMVYITMGINCLFTLIIMLIYCLQCIPLDAFFQPAEHPDVKCLNKNTLAFPPAAFVRTFLSSYYYGLNELVPNDKQSITVDVLIVVLPIRPLWAIQVSIRKRIALISVVSLGAIVVLISCARLIVLLEFDPNGSDFTWVLGKLIIISSIELEVAIIAANAPSLTVMCQKWFGKRGSTLGSLETGRNEYGYSVNCVSMTDRESKKKEVDKRLHHSDSEEHLWNQESVIIVERSVGVEISDNASGETVGVSKSSREQPRANSRMRFQQASTPPTEEEDERERGGR